MKTTWNIKDIAEKKEIENAYRLHTLTGISHPRILKFWKGYGKMAPEDIDVLCRVLECQPKDLIKILEV